MWEDVLTLIVVIIVIAVIVYLSYLFSRYLSKGAGGMNGARHMSVIDRLPVGQDRYIIILRVLDQYYLASVTGQSINILKELDASAIRVSAEDAPKGINMETFKTTLQNFLSKKK